MLNYTKPYQTLAALPGLAWVYLFMEIKEKDRSHMVKGAKVIGQKDEKQNQKDKKSKISCSLEILTSALTF